MEDIKARVDDLEKRVSELEKVQTSRPQKVVRAAKDKYFGPAGGVRMLFDRGFFDTPRDVLEVKTELEKDARRYSFTPLSNAMIRAVSPSKLMLAREKVGGKWKYFTRK